MIAKNLPKKNTPNTALDSKHEQASETSRAERSDLLEHGETEGQRTHAKKATRYETFTVPSNIDTVTCNGGHELFGHPKVYYSFGNKNFAACHYCSRVFIREKKPA